MSSPATRRAFDFSGDIIARAQEVIELEARTLLTLAASLDDAFVSACNLLSSATGRIVIAGVGKSGHIGRKMAATFSATGAPAIYVHPGEAAHGDLGMIVPGDVIIVISNSGNTAELRVLFDHARKFDIPTVGMTSALDSLVGRSCNVCILMPPAEEACPVNIAPTSSTAQQLALGDALAMVLMDKRDIGRDDIKSLHPGGTIGLRLATVGELMHVGDKLPLVPLDLPMDAVISQMTKMGFGIAGVIDEEGHLAGMITDGDIRRHFKILDKVTAHEVMTPHPKVLSAGMAAEDALRFLNNSKVTCAFIVAEPDSAYPAVGGGAIANGLQKPIGIIHLHDFLRLGLS